MNLSDYYRNQFFQEARDILEQVNDDLLRSESNPENMEIMNAIFRGIHTIKGSAGSFELDAMSEFAHHLENILDHLRNGRLALTAELVDAILWGFDQLHSLLEAYAAGDAPHFDNELIKHLNSFITDSQKDYYVAPKVGEEKELPRAEEKIPEASQSCKDGNNGLNQYRLRIHYTSEHMVNGYDPLILLKNIKENSSDYKARSVGAEVPALDAYEPLFLYLNSEVFLSTELSAEELGELSFNPDLLDIEPCAATDSKAISRDDTGTAWSAIPRQAHESLKGLMARGHSVYQIRILYGSEHLQHGFDPLVLLRNLKAISSFYYATDEPPAFPALSEFEPFHLYLYPSIILAAPVGGEQIADLSFDPELVQVELLRQPLSSVNLADTDLSIDPVDLEDFIVGSSELLDSLEKAAIVYEAEGGSASLNEIFRAVHTIKGDSGYLGLNEMCTLSHALESMLERLRGGRSPKTDGTVDIILQSADHIRQCLRALREGRLVTELPPVVKKLHEFIQPDVGGKPAPNNTVFSNNMDRVYVEQAVQKAELFQSLLNKEHWEEADEKNLLRALDGMEKASAVVGVDTILDKVSSARTDIESGGREGTRKLLAEIVAFAEGLRDEPKRLGEILVEEGKISREDLQAGLDQQKPLGAILVDSGKVTEEDVQRALNKQSLMEAASQARPTTGVDNEIRTMRVDERKIDQFGNFVGELLVVRNTYEYLFKQLADLTGVGQEVLKAVRENQHLLTRLTNDIHHGVMGLRMIPIRGIFQRFQRVVRDISRKQKKEIEYSTEGEEIEIDKKVADSLADPLIHLIRNACDHGVEVPGERIDAGKPEKATVRIHASQEGSNLTIRVTDDGRGIDRLKLYEKVIHGGYQVETPDDPGLLDYIFMPGLSTRDEVTDVSGRGVGMDVVKTAIQALNGTVSVSSQEKAGTKVTLSIPMTMGISAVLLVESSSGIYAMPLDAVLETLKVRSEKIRRAGRQNVMHHRDRIIVVEHLDNLLNSAVDKQESASELKRDAEESIVVIETGAGQFGVIVDHLIGNMEMAVKPLPGALAGINLYSGVSLMGDGRVIFVLNPEFLTSN